MSDTQFTRADWRPSRKRASYPRVRNWGGRKAAPPAFLAAGAAMREFAPGAPRCAHCKRVAMRDLPVCRHHGGGRWTSSLRPYVARAAIRHYDNA